MEWLESEPRAALCFPVVLTAGSLKSILINYKYPEKMELFCLPDDGEEMPLWRA